MMLLWNNISREVRYYSEVETRFYHVEKIKYERISRIYGIDPTTQGSGNL